MRAYAVLIVFSSVCLLASFFTVKDIMDDELKRNTNLLLKQVANEYDDAFKKAEDFAAACSGNDIVRHYALYSNSPADDRTRYEMLTLMKRFSELKNASGGRGSYYLYFSDSDIVTTTESNIENPLFFQILNTDITFDEWKNLLSADTGKRIVKIPTKDGGCKYLYTARRMFTRAFDKANLTFFALWDKSDFASINSEDFEDANLYLRFSPNDFVGIKDIENLNDPLPEVLNETVKLDKKQYYCAFLPSGTWNMQYVLLFSLYRVKSKLLYLMVIYIIIELIILAGGITMSRRFANKNYTPIRNIKDMMQNYTGKLTDTEREDEFEFISDAITNLVESYNTVTQNSLSQKAKLHDKYIQELLSENNTDEKKTIRELSLFGINFISDRFIILLIHSDCEGFENAADKISEIMESELNEDYVPYIIRKEGFLVCLINIENASDSDAEQCMADTADKISAKIGGINLNFASSGIVNGIKALHSAYMNTLMLMDYKITLGVNGGLYMRDIFVPSAETGFYYTVDTENSLISSIKSGNAEEAAETVKKVFEGVMKSKWIVMGTKCFAYDILCTIIKATDGMHDRIGDYFASLRTSAKIMSLDNSEKITSVLIEDITSLCDFINRDETRISLLERKVMDYIAEHYGDYDLSLQKIADVLGMHPVYLSSSFKEQCGENISDRITKMRLTRSVELLRNGLSVNETAKSVGYINTRTFSDAFRRYYGQTPSKIFK